MAYTLINQDPTLLNSPRVYDNAIISLQDFVPLWLAIEAATGHRWRCTSFVRRSPSHQHGVAIDLTPYVTDRDLQHYSVTKMSDPVLYKRVPMIRALQRVAQNFLPKHGDIGIFIEPDHLHIQRFTASEPPRVELVKWKQPKFTYPDTLQRMKLPLIH